MWRWIVRKGKSFSLQFISFHPPKTLLENEAIIIGLWRWAWSWFSGLIDQHFLLILLGSDIFNQHFLHIWLMFFSSLLPQNTARRLPSNSKNVRNFFQFSYMKLTISIAINVPKACLIMNELTSVGVKEKPSLYWPIWMTIYNKLCKAIYLIASRSTRFYGQFINPQWIYSKIITNREKRFNFFSVFNFSFTSKLILCSFLMHIPLVTNFMHFSSTGLSAGTNNEWWKKFIFLSMEWAAIWILTLITCKIATIYQEIFAHIERFGILS